MPLHERRHPASVAARPALPFIGEVVPLRAAARAAEDEGDFAGALRLVRRLPHSARWHDWEQQLCEASKFPAGPSPALARWMVNPALRWALERPAVTIFSEHAELLLKPLGLPAASRAESAARLAETDPVVVDAGLFDGGWFGRYLAEAAGVDLLARAGPVKRWSACPFSVWRYGGAAQAGAARLYDLWTDQPVTAVTWGVPAGSGELLYGRLVPVAGLVPLAFAVRPVVVDRRCSVRLLRARRRGAGPQERLRAIARSRLREREALEETG